MYASDNQPPLVERRGIELRAILAALPRSSGCGYSEVSAYFQGEGPIDFVVSWDGGCSVQGGVDPNGVSAAFSQQFAAM